jgi:UDP-4-amino-4,6-dideoxy-N-acetyl-beta-L-altrosamine transaminase
MIPYSRQSISTEDIEAVVSVLESDFLTQGGRVEDFEQAISDQVSADHAIAFNSATSALHCACLALGISDRETAWTVPNTFVASATCSLLSGGKVDFVDIDPTTWNISIQQLRDKLISAKKNDSLPRVLIPVHFGGQPTDQEEIWELSKEFGFGVIEDASHSLGASRNQEPVGSCRWSDITVFSFHPVKGITTGEGGMAVTQHKELSTQLRLLRSHGITRELIDPSISAREPWRYEQVSLGYNYRLCDINAALGLSQLKQLPMFLDKRRQIANNYDHLLQSLPLQLPVSLSQSRSAWHLYPIRINTQVTGVGRREVHLALKQKNIETTVHYHPVHLQPFFKQLGYSLGDFPESEAHGNEALSIPIHPNLSNQQQNYISQTLIGLFQ